MKDIIETILLSIILVLIGMLIGVAIMKGTEKHLVREVVEDNNNSYIISCYLED